MNIPYTLQRVSCITHLKMIKSDLQPGFNVTALFFSPRAPRLYWPNRDSPDKP